MIQNLADKLYEIRTLLKEEKRPSLKVRSALQLVERLEGEVTAKEIEPASMRTSLYPTIESATAEASRIARAQTKPVAVIADQPHDGGFTLAEPTAVDADAVYMNVDRNGDASEGPKCKELPIGFTGALPH